MIRIQATESASDKFKEMTELLQHIGVNLVVENDQMYLDIDEEQLKKSITRYAGVKRKRLVTDGVPTEISIEKAKEMIHLYGREEAGKMLGVSGKTLYRRLKDAEEKGQTTIF